MCNYLAKMILTSVLLGTISVLVSAGVSIGPIGPRVLPDYPWVGRAGVGADFMVRCSIANGRVQAVRVVEASIDWNGREPVPADMEDPQDPGPAFFQSIEQALKQWTFDSETTGDFEIRIRFRSILGSEGDYIDYRYGSSDLFLPRRIDIVAHHSLNID